MNRSWDEHRKQTLLDKETAGQTKLVKPTGTDQRAEPSPARSEGKSNAEDEGLWEQVWERKNLLKVLKRVEANGGAPGIDGMTVQELTPYLKEQWLDIRERLDAGKYQPSPVRRAEIRKPDGGKRL